MNVGAILRAIFHSEIPPSPANVNLPDESELRWAKSQTDAMKRRARELQLEIDLDIRKLK